MSGVNYDSLNLDRPFVLVREMAADKLRNAILAGVLAPGERLVEASLAKSMGVSRPSIREALSQLIAERLVTVVPNRGPAVATISWEDAQAIYEVRALLEAEAAAQFAKRATDDDIARLESALRDFEGGIATGDINRLLLATSNFYGAILGRCGNPVIKDVLDGLNARISFLRARSMSQDGRPPQSLSEMTAIFKAVQRKNSDAARRASTKHVANAASNAKAAFEAAQNGARS
jgi:DNA-binding GntR family transcriptional regulator